MINSLIQQIKLTNKASHQSSYYYGRSTFDINYSLFDKYQITNSIHNFDLDVEAQFDKITYFRKNSIIILIFDYNNPEIFEDLSKLAAEIIKNQKTNYEKYPPILIVGQGIKPVDRDDSLNDKILSLKNRLEKRFHIFIPFIRNPKNYFKGDTLIYIINFLSILVFNCQIKVKNETQLRDYYYIMNLGIKDGSHKKYLTEAIEFISTNRINNTIDTDPIHDLRKIIENSNDEILESLALIQLCKMSNEIEYIQNLVNNQKLSEFAVDLASIISSNNWNELEKIIFGEEEDDIVNEYLVELIPDPLILEKICLEHPNIKVKISAYTKLIPHLEKIPENILSVVLNGFPVNLAVETIQKLDDNNLLNEIIIGTYDRDIIIAAIKKFEGRFSPKIIKILTEDRSQEIRGPLIAKIQNEDELLQIINGDYNHFIQKVAFRHLKNYTTEVLTEVIFHSPNIELKKISIEMIQDQNILYQFLTAKELNSRVKAIVLKNLKNLEQQFLLKYLSDYYGDYYIPKVIYPLLKIDDDFSKDDLLTICKNEKDPENLVLLFNQITSVKHLLLLRVTLDSSVQAQITERINELENNKSKA